jgi:membrane-bound lytic murein transglycosylase D
MQSVFEQHGLPQELAFLPHVESSFDYKAYSKAGAAGIWQFTRGTGRRYLRINRYSDERLDPIRATRAAARLMRDNYAVLGNWPLAITSYNHGKYGMMRAKKRHGSDLSTIINHYRSSHFGFASKNFYAEFLAALSVAKNYRHYFGPLELGAPPQFDTVRLKASYDSSWITSVPGLNREVLISCNPHLRRLFSSSGRVIPSGTELRVPKGKGESLSVALKSVKPSSSNVMVAADGSLRYRVRSGDALGDIASQFGTSTRKLQKLNGIRNANRIRVGQVLLIETGSASPPRAEARSNMTSTHRVRAGDNLSKIAARMNTTVAELARTNQLSDPDRIRAGMVLRSPTAEPPARQYKVRRGDTLARIARKFGTSVAEIMRANGIRNANRIRKGQRLVIP